MKIKTRDVLKIIAVSSIVLASVAAPNIPIAIGSLYKEWKKVNKRDLGKIIKRLEKQSMIGIYEEKGKTIIEITEKGRKRLLEYDFENIDIRNKKMDGKWRLIMFDIPNQQRISRDAFRKKLEQLGCIKLQESVYTSAYPCQKEIDFLCHYLNISDFVTLISVDRIERGEQLHFNKFPDWEVGQ